MNFLAGLVAKMGGPLLKWGLVAAMVLSIVWAIYARGDNAGYARGHLEAVTVKGQWDADRSRMQQAAAQAEAQRASNAAARAVVQEKVEKHAFIAQEHRDAARAAGDVARSRLLDAARAAAADSDRCAADYRAAVVAGGGDAGGAGGVPGGDGSKQPDPPIVGVLGWSDETSGELAGYADALVGALQACRVEYASVRHSNSLTPGGAR